MLFTFWTCTQINFMTCTKIIVQVHSMTVSGDKVHHKYPSFMFEGHRVAPHPISAPLLLLYKFRWWTKTISLSKSLNSLLKWTWVVLHEQSGSVFLAFGIQNPLPLWNILGLGSAKPNCLQVSQAADCWILVFICVDCISPVSSIKTYAANCNTFWLFLLELTVIPSLN